MTASTDSFILIDHLTEGQKDQLHMLYQEEWWSKDRSRQDVDFILEHSSFILAVIDEETKELVGFSRLLTDYFKYAYFYDFIVKKELRSQGVGEMILTALFSHPVIKKCGRLELTCKEEMENFYQKYGFTQNYGSIISMRKIIL